MACRPCDHGASFSRNDARSLQSAASPSNSRNRVSSSMARNLVLSLGPPAEAPHQHGHDAVTQRFSRPPLFQLLVQRRLDHGLATSQDLEQPRIIIPQTAEKLSHNQPVRAFLGRRLAVDAGPAPAHDRLGWPVELSERDPGDHAKVACCEEFLGRNLPQLDDAPGDITRREATAAVALSSSQRPRAAPLG